MDGAAPVKHVTSRQLLVCLTIAILVAAGLPIAAALAQTTVPAPQPVESAPLQPPAAAVQPAPVQAPPAAPAEPAPAPSVAPPAAAPSPAPAPAPVQTPPPPQPAPPVTAQPPATAAPATPTVDRNATLAGKPGDTMGVDTLVLAPKPALTISGQTTWDRGIETLAGIFQRLENDAGRLGLKVAGRPLTYFAETDDIGFRYEAILPVDRLPDNAAQLGDVRAGSTPSGNALRFTHKSPYDDIDSTYEGITAYLDAKGLTVRDQFVEEYVGDLKDPGDAGFEVNIYVQPR